MMKSIYYATNVLYFFLFFVLGSESVPGLAATIEVAPGAVEVNVGDGFCSLREAILNANADNDSSGGDCMPGSGADTIRLSAGSIYSLPNNFANSTGLPPLIGATLIEGNGAFIERATDATGEFRLLQVTATANVTLQDLTLRGANFPGIGAGILNHGMLLLSNSAVRDGISVRSGVGIYNSGTLRALDSEITGNNLDRARNGGGIYNDGGTVTLINTLISNNTANDSGGGIYNDSGSVTIENSIISNNRADGLAEGSNGGGLCNFFGEVTVQGSELHGNFALNSGGGLFSEGGVLVIEQSTLRNNSSSSNGGDAIYSTGILTVTQSTLTANTGSFSYTVSVAGAGTIANSTISGNGPSDGSAEGVILALSASSITLSNVTLVNNEGEALRTNGNGIIRFQNSILEGCFNASGLISLGYNLFLTDENTCSTSGPEDLFVDPAALFTTVLGPLADNGGPTLTHALLEGSPALDVASCTDADGNPLTTDQRGETRPSDDPDIANTAGGCDIGAVELQVETAADTTPPECQIDQLLPGPPMTLVVRTQDPGSGLSAINIVQAKNATVTVPAFTPGTTNEIFVTAEKNNQSKNATVVLDVFDVAGNKTRCDPVLTEVSAEVPEAFALQQNYPNPFNPTTTIPFQVVEPSQVTLVVYDMLGRRVTVLVDGALTAGTYEAVWDGRSAAGMMLPGGVYVYRLRAGAYEQTRVMTLLK